MNEVESGDARISDCGRYRYWLYRGWCGDPPCAWIMLNPSTADALEDDPTIRRCISFSRREGFGAMFVANLYGLRATDPKQLRKAEEPCDPPNIGILRRFAREFDTLIVAWGGLPFATEHGKKIERILREERAGRPLMCLGTTGSGAPRHPLYLRGDQPLIEWRGYGRSQSDG